MGASIEEFVAARHGFGFRNVYQAAIFIDSPRCYLLKEAPSGWSQFYGFCLMMQQVTASFMRGQATVGTSGANFIGAAA